MIVDHSYCLISRALDRGVQKSRFSVFTCSLLHFHDAVVLFLAALQSIFVVEFSFSLC